jgi:hypothetical protein
MFLHHIEKNPRGQKDHLQKIVCDYKTHKQEKERVRLTVGGDRLDYSGDVATSTADIKTLKILINITLSTEDVAMMMMDIKNYYLGTPMPGFEYMKMLLSRFPEEIVQKYNLNSLAVDGWVYIEIRKGMYGLKQAGLLGDICVLCNPISKSYRSITLLSSQLLVLMLVKGRSGDALHGACQRI